jgi:NAD-dependent dihydropyrimidine dehydrogenase PreA subunit
MKKAHYLLLTILFVLLLAWGIDHNKPLPPAPASLIAEGYGGPIEMALTTSSKGTITDLKILKHNETSSYISRLDDFLKQFIGRTRQDSFVLGKDIDAISGATITSTGITAAVRARMSVPGPDEKAPASTTPVLISLVLFLIATIAFIRRNNALRWAALIGGFVYFGIITHTMLSIIQITQAGVGRAPIFTSNPLWWALIVLAVPSTFIIGRIYCGSLCPFASIQEILFQLTPHKHPLKEHVDPKIDQRTRLIKYALLFVITSICLILGNTSAANIEPFITLFTGYGSKLALALLALMLIMAVFNFRFWCKYLCPVGALTSLTAAFALNNIRPSSKCTACGTCSKACPTQAITTNAQGIPCINSAECIVCAKCLRTCPENALTFGCRCHEKK